MTPELQGAVVMRSARRHAGAQARVSQSVEGGLRSLHAATQAELRRRAAMVPPLEPAAVAPPVPVRTLSSISREVPRLAAEAPGAARSAAASLAGGAPLDVARAMARFAARQAELAVRHGRGEVSVDDFGFDREWTESLLPMFSWLYHSYWRVQAVNVENVPAEGRALLVSNHAGVLPYDGAMIRVAVFEQLHRHARALILNAFFGVPIASWFLRRTGNTLAHPDDAERLLDQDELVLVFPEGARGTGKPYRDRYRLRRFGRGGFVQVALRTGSPIIPVSVVGSEEVHPMVANLPPVASALGLPYFPLTPTFPWLGPLGVVPLPSSWIIEFHEPIATTGFARGQAHDPSLVMDLGERVRETIQAGVYRNLERRGSVFAPAH